MALSLILYFLYFQKLAPVVHLKFHIPFLNIIKQINTHNKNNQECHYLQNIPIKETLISDDNNIELIIFLNSISMLSQLSKNCAVNIKSNRLMSCLSLSTMTLLILASVVIITIINVTPIVILGLGELQDGQRDMIITPKLDYINITKISLQAQQPIMPRINTILFAGNQQANGWFMDFNLQKQLHLGTIGGNQPQNHNFIYAHQNLNLPVGSHPKITMVDKSFLKAIKEQVSNNQIYAQNKEQLLVQLDQLTFNSVVLRGTFTVKQVFGTASGKFGIGSINNFLYLDVKYAFRQIIEETYQNAGKSLQTSPFIKLLRSNHFNFGDFATEATINIPNRIEVYSNPDYQQTYTYSVDFGERILQKIGLFSVSTRMPIAANLINLGYVGMFIGVMLKLIIVSLFMLSTIMMNNMLLMGVQRKTFDFALLKVMGANKLFIVLNLLTSSLKYVLLANFIAYPLAYAVLGTVTDVFESFFGYKHEIKPTFYSILGGVIIGVFVPIISSIAPIWGVIKNDLVQNLNPLRNKTQAIKTQIYIQGKQFPMGKLTFGILATSYGLMIYYLLPRSLINQSIGLLLIIFFIILQGLLIGLILLSYSFQYIFQRIVAYICLFWINKTDLMLTLKNLSSHRFKNRRSSILYALSVSFIIFVSVGLSIQLQTIYNQLLKKRGCYVEVNGGYIDRQFYNQKLPQIQGVQDWAFITMPLSKHMSFRGVKQIMISDKAKIFFAKNEIYGVSPNLINTFFFDKVSVYKTQATTPYDPYSYLYSQQGYMTCTISKYIAERFGIIDGNNKQFYINYYYNNMLKRIPIKYSSIFDKRIGLLYSSVIQFSEIGVSFDTFRTLADIKDDSNIPIQKIKVKVRNASQANVVANRIRGLNTGDVVWQYTQLKDTINRIQKILNNILTILLVLVLIISFFSLVTTTYVNIITQTNEIGILMILGYQKSRIVKIYIYQCFVLVINSCLIGIAVGYFVAWMMGLQRELFSDLPVEIQVKGLNIIVIGAVVSSILCTYKPLKEIFDNTISQIMNYAK